jgi:uncharacterized protein (TIGR03437 family)
MNRIRRIIGGHLLLNLARAAGLIGVFALCFPLQCWAQTYTITTFAGGGTPYPGNGDGGPATSANIFGLTDVAVDAAGNLYIADGVVRKVSQNGIISTVAGNPNASSLGDGGPATQAQVSADAIAVDAAGNIYVSEVTIADDRIRKVDVQGTITTVAGNGQSGSSGDGGPATSATLGDVLGLAVDAAGNLYLVDDNGLLRKVDTSGIITTVAGRGTSSDDGVPAATASLGYPSGVAIDSGGNIYIADANRNQIRKVSTGGIITTVAGNGTATYSGDGGPATQAGIASPWHVAVDTAGNIYITERLDGFAQSSGNFVRKVTPDGIITTIAGDGNNGFSGDGGPATNATFDDPLGIAAGGGGKVYVADTQNYRVRLLTPASAPAGSLPSVASGGVVSASAFGKFSAVAPGSLMEIYGSNLAVATMNWGSAFNGINAPTSLDGTSVTIGGEDAFVAYVSPGQVNVQVPSGVGIGPQPVIVKTGSGTSSPSMITVKTTEPGLLAPASFKIGGKQYVAAFFVDHVTLALPPGAIPGVPSRRAKPGDPLTLYGIGFGDVIPNMPAGQIAQGSTMLAASFEVKFGTTPAMVTYAGLAPGETGVYQFDVTVPSVPSNDATQLTFTLGGVAGTQTLYIAVQNGGPAVEVQSVTLSANSVPGGAAVQGTVSLTTAAPAGGAEVALSSNSSAVTVPATVTVPSDATSATFTVTTSAVSSNQASTISASYGGEIAQAQLTVTVAATLPQFNIIIIHVTTAPSQIPGLPGPPELGIAQILVAAPASDGSYIVGTVQGGGGLGSAEPSLIQYAAGWSGVSVSGQTLTFDGLDVSASTMEGVNGDIADITSGTLSVTLYPQPVSTSGTVTGSMTLVSTVATVSGSFTGTYVAQ